MSLENCSCLILPVRLDRQTRVTGRQVYAKYIPVGKPWPTSN